MLPHMTVMLVTKIMTNKKHRNCSMFLLTLPFRKHPDFNMSKHEKYVTQITEEKQ